MARKFGLWRAFVLALIAASLAEKSSVADDPAADKKASDPAQESRGGIDSSPAPDWDVVAANRKAYRRIAEVLSKPATFGFDNTPFNEFVDTLEAELGERVYVDKRKLADAGVDPAALHVTFRKSPVSRRSALDLILHEHDLTWVVKHETLWITTPDAAQSALETRVYDISDRDASGEYVHGDMESLIELIMANAAPTTWDAVGGAGNIKEYQTTNIYVLVISQTQSIHEQIERLLADLRAAQHKFDGKTPLKKSAADRVLEEAFESAGQLRSIDEPALQPDENRDAVVHGANDMAFDLYRQLTADNEGNIFYSPHSVAVALAMLRAGATNETGAEISKVLRFEGETAKLHAGYGSLRTALRGILERRGYELRVANRLWAGSRFAIEDEFVNTLQTHYGGELEVVDFKATPEAARETINAWVADHTADRIRDLIQPHMITSETRSVLANAVYFNARWANPFEETDTKRLPFNAVAGRRMIPTMTQETDLPYAEMEADGVRAVELRYGPDSFSSTASMIVLLPNANEGGLAALEKSLSADYIEKVVTKLKTANVKLYFPKFTFRASLGLEDPLKALGIRRAFDPSQAQFDALSTEQPFFLTFVTHQAFLRVDEKGTEAAAATGGGGAGGFSEPPKKVVFRADRPFVLLIRDDRTKSILFAGRIVSPPSDEAK
jgi:serpin B